MPERRAIELALDLSRMPALAPILRRQAPPHDILDAIRAAAGCPEALQAACSSTKEPLHVIQRAAALYVQETLFFPGASLHRNLGVTNQASRAQMRLHMRWLMRWLHPDHNSDEMARLLAARVIEAWRELGQRKAQIKKAPVAIDKVACATKSSAAELKGSYALRLRWIPIPIRSTRSTRALRLILAGTVIALVVIALSDVALVDWLSAKNRGSLKLTRIDTDLPLLDLAR
jgi:hypothetical protein